MIPNIDCKPTLKPFKEITGFFITVNFDGEYLLWVKIPELVVTYHNNMSNNTIAYNAYCFRNDALSHFADNQMVTDPKNVDMKVEF